jgi:hypothetical protein
MENHRRVKKVKPVIENDAIKDKPKKVNSKGIIIMLHIFLLL